MISATSIEGKGLTVSARQQTDRWFGSFYDTHADFVRRVVCRLAGPGGDADEWIQDVFLVAHRRWPEMADRSAPRAWLYGVAVRVVSAGRRRHRLRRFLRLDDVPHLADEVTPATDFEHREQSERVYRLIDSLPEKKRSVLLLHELEELSGAEIAGILGCPIKTVWTRLFHARKAFEQALARDELRERRESAGGLP